LKQRKNLLDLFKNLNLSLKLSIESSGKNYEYSLMCYPFKLDEISRLNFIKQNSYSHNENKYMNENIMFRDNILKLENFASNELNKINLFWENAEKIDKYVINNFNFIRKKK